MPARWYRSLRVRPGSPHRTGPTFRFRRLMGEGPAADVTRGKQGTAGRTIPRRRSEEEQGHAAAPPTDVRPEPQIAIVVDPQLGGDARRQALELVTRLAQRAPRPVLHARLTLRQLPDPALARPVVAKATLDVAGRPVRAHVAAETGEQALGRLDERLRRGLEDLEATRRAHRHETGVAEPGRWRHGTLAIRPEYFDRPVEEREVVRRKTYALSPLTPEEAVVEMDTLDQDFHLFTRADTGEESVVHRLPEGGIRLLCVRPPGPGDPEIGFVTDPAPAPVLVVEDAVERLDVGGEPFLFFVDAQTRRGNLLYRRYDGHYGLIEPAVDG